MDLAEAQRQGALVLEVAASIVTASVEKGMLGDVRTIKSAIAAAEFLRQHAEFVRMAKHDDSKPFTLGVEGDGC